MVDYFSLYFNYPGFGNPTIPPDPTHDEDDEEAENETGTQTQRHTYDI